MGRTTVSRRSTPRSGSELGKRGTGGWVSTSTAGRRSSFSAWRAGRDQVTCGPSAAQMSVGQFFRGLRFGPVLPDPFIDGGIIGGICCQALSLSLTAATSYREDVVVTHSRQYTSDRFHRSLASHSFTGPLLRSSATEVRERPPKPHIQSTPKARRCAWSDFSRVENHGRTT